MLNLFHYTRLRQNCTGFTKQLLKIVFVKGNFRKTRSYHGIELYIWPYYSKWIRIRENPSESSFATSIFNDLSVKLSWQSDPVFRPSNCRLLHHRYTYSIYMESKLHFDSLGANICRNLGCPQRIFISDSRVSPPLRCPQEALTQPLSTCSVGSYTDGQVL